MLQFTCQLPQGILLLLHENSRQICKEGPPSFISDIGHGVYRDDKVVNKTE